MPDPALDGIQVYVEDMRRVVGRKEGEIVFHDVQQQVGKEKNGFECVFGGWYLGRCLFGIESDN